MRAGNISFTAWLVVACLYALTKDRRWHSLVPQAQADFYKHCMDYCACQSPAYWGHANFPHAWRLFLVDNALARGAPQHYALRKHMLSKQAETSVANGATQLVVLGGGFDDLAVRMSVKYPHVECFEIDVPAMHHHKMNIVGEYYDGIPANFHGIGADLGHTSLYDVLFSAKDFRSDQPTVFVAEGISMYLSERGMIDVLQTIRRLCQAQAELLFSAIETHKIDRKGWKSGVLKGFLGASSERFSWGISCEGMSDFLKLHGYVQEHLVTYAELQRPWRFPQEMPGLERQNGEYLIYAKTTEASEALKQHSSGA